MKQKYFLFNPNLCLGCRACQTACAANHDLSPDVFLRKVSKIEFIHKDQLVNYFLSLSCNHCANPECLRLCPEHAYRKRRDGIVIQDDEKCKGCGTCTRGCPFEAPVVNPKTGKTIKCDLCYDRLEEDEKPFCVTSCPVEALTFRERWESDNDDPDLIKMLPGIPKIQITQPAVRYYSVKMGIQIGLNLSYTKEEKHNNET